MCGVMCVNMTESDPLCFSIRKAFSVPSEMQHLHHSAGCLNNIQVCHEVDGHKFKLFKEGFHKGPFILP